jgi:hypothetical protein
MIITRGQPGGTSRDGPAAVEERLRRHRGADPECYSGVGADAACSEAWSRDFEASPNLEFTVCASIFGKVCLRHSLRFRRASARHSYETIMTTRIVENHKNCTPEEFRRLLTIREKLSR